MKETNSRILIISQVFPPDPAAVGQYFDEAAQALIKKGARVEVLTANRGYDDPSAIFPAKEERGGVLIRRLPYSSFGKGGMLVRLAGQLSFIVQSFLRALFSRGLNDLLVSTSPPMCGVVAVVVGWLRPSLRIHYWLMDLNPDQAVALKAFGARHPLVYCMRWLNRRILKRSKTVIALDRFMKDRFLRQAMDGALSAGVDADKVTVLPPWPMGQHMGTISHSENWFREQNGWTDRLVVMFSGNHSWVHPLTTVLDAAERLKDDSRFAFVFIGGGKGKAEVDERIHALNGATNLGLNGALFVSMPYQDLDVIPYSLSAADVHLVSLGSLMNGIVHPCKIYGALAVGRPILALGPKESYLGDILSGGKVGWSVEHDAVDEMVAVLKQLVALSVSEREEMGQRARVLVEEQYSRDMLLSQFVDLIVE